MKQFKEYLNEALGSVTKGAGKDFPDQTPGKPAVWADGTQVPNSLAISKKSMVTVDGNYYVITSAVGLSGDLHTIMIQKSEFDLLRKFKG